MSRLTTSRICRSSQVYLTLLVLTIFTWHVGESTSGGFLLSTLVLMVAMVKGMLIGDYFMQLKPVNTVWRYAVMLWLLLPGVSIGWAFYISL